MKNAYILATALVTATLLAPHAAATNAFEIRSIDLPSILIGEPDPCRPSEPDSDGDDTCDRLDPDDDNDGAPDGCDPKPRSYDDLDWVRWVVKGGCGRAGLADVSGTLAEAVKIS